MAQTKTHTINRSLTTKKVDQFYVEFLDMPDNISNILGRQITSIERPTITFREFEYSYKGAAIHDHGKLEFSAVSAVLLDDDKSLTIKAVYDQLYRQLGTGTNISPSEAFENARFLLRVKCFSGSGDLVESFDLLKCFITGVTHSEQVYSDSTTPNTITLSIRYDNVQYEY